MDALAVPAWLAQLKRAGCDSRAKQPAIVAVACVALLGGALARTVAASLGAEPADGQSTAARNAESQRLEPEQPEQPEQAEQPEQPKPERKSKRRGLLRRCRTDPGAYGRVRFHTAPLPGSRSVQWLDERTAGDSSDDDGENVASSEKQEELAAPSAECLRQTRRSKLWSRRFVRIDGDGQLQVFDSRETAQRGGSPKSSSFYLRGCTVSTAETPTSCQLTIRRTDGPKSWVSPRTVYPRPSMSPKPEVVNNCSLCPQDVKFKLPLPLLEERTSATLAEQADFARLCNSATNVAAGRDWDDHGESEPLVTPPDLRRPVAPRGEAPVSHTARAVRKTNSALASARDALMPACSLSPFPPPPAPASLSV